MWWVWCGQNRTRFPPKRQLSTLAEAREAQRLRLAFLGAREAAFDWMLSDDRIEWLVEGTLPPGPADLARIRHRRGIPHLAVAGGARRTGHAHVASPCPTIRPSPSNSKATPRGPANGSSCAPCARPAQSGRAERVTGVLKLITPQKRMLKRLTYLACFDELTGHLNRTRLRERLTSVIQKAVAEDRSCAYVVASIDRLAVINETYGFDVADEVIVAAGQRLAQTLRGSDVIGRTAGNKFGVILADCGENEMTPGRRAAARGGALRSDRDARGFGVGHGFGGRGVAAPFGLDQPGGHAARRRGDRAGEEHGPQRLCGLSQIGAEGIVAPPADDHCRRIWSKRSTTSA